jgi:hypothetical protein
LRGVYKGQTKERSLEIAELVKLGRYSFDEAEVAAVVAYAHKVLSVPASTLLKDGVKWLVWPAYFWPSSCSSFCGRISTGRCLGAWPTRRIF